MHFYFLLGWKYSNQGTLMISFASQIKRPPKMFLKNNIVVLNIYFTNKSTALFGSSTSS